MASIHEVVGKAPAMNKFAPMPNRGTSGTRGHLKVSGGSERGSIISKILNTTDNIPDDHIIGRGHESRIPMESNNMETAKLVTSMVGFDPFSRTDLLRSKCARALVLEGDKAEDIALAELTRDMGGVWSTKARSERLRC